MAVYFIKHGTQERTEWERVECESKTELLGILDEKRTEPGRWAFAFEKVMEFPVPSYRIRIYKGWNVETGQSCVIPNGVVEGAAENA